jgi:hypothetical protein
MVRTLRTACAVAAGLAACLSLAGLPAQAATSAAHGWRLTNVYGRGAANIDAAGLAVVSRHSAWSLWDECTWPCDSGSPPTVVRHWTGQHWSVVPATELDGMSAQIVTGSSASDVWLFGLLPGHRNYGALHWNGKVWARRAVPDWLITANGSLSADVYPADFSPNNLWLFSLGGYVGEKRAFAAHYQHGRWSKVYLADIPNAASASGPDSIWLLAQSTPSVSQTGPTYLLRWNGSHWSRTKFPEQREPGLPAGLTATGPDDLWTTWIPAKAGAQYLLHWTGTRWSKVSFPASGAGAPATGDGAGGLWLNGFAAGKARVQLFLHWSAGRWSSYRVPQPGWLPGNVDYLALIPGTTSVWAVGNVYGHGGGTTLNRGAVWRFS